MAASTNAPEAADACPKPTEEQCLAKGYYASKCGRKHESTCAPVFRKKYENDFKRAGAPKDKMLAVEGSDIPKDLRKGHKRRRYAKPKKGREVALAGKSVLARSGLTRSPGSGVGFKAAKQAHRQPSWDKNDQKINSCQEYAYEQLYDAMRFTDAMGACAGNRTCELDIAYLADAPGVADRRLERKDGRKLLTQIELAHRALPKNDMFSVAAFYSRIPFANDPVLDEGRPDDPDAGAIAKALRKGERWYGVGTCTGKSCGAAKGDCKDKMCVEHEFHDEWDFHRKLRKRNEKLTAAEFAEYERRKRQFRRLYDEWRASAGKGWYIIEHGKRRAAATKTKAKLIKPIDLVTGDPIERMGVMVDEVEAQADRARKSAAAAGKAQPSAARPALGVLASPAPAKQRKASNRCSPAHWGTPDDAAVADALGRGPGACRLADFLIREWRRMKKGQKSCLDLDDDDCDWSPEMFHDRFVAKFSYGGELHRHETECETATGGTIRVDNLAQAERYIARMREKIEIANAALADYRLDRVTIDDEKKMWRLGGHWADAEAMGDKDWFAAGYQYDVGWHVQPEDLSGKKICDLSGSAHANFAVNGWIVKNQISILDGQARGDANVAGSGRNHILTKLSLFGIEVSEATFDDYVSTAWAPDPWIQREDVPKGWKPTFQFQAGPIPITGSAWGSLFFGAELSAAAKLQAADQCDPKKLQFGIEGNFTPSIGVDGSAQLGFGVPGLSAGIRGALNLISIELPVDVALRMKKLVVTGNTQLGLAFEAGVGLALATLAGHISLYIEYVIGSEEWELFRWSGLKTSMRLMNPPLQTELPIVGWPK